MVKIPYDKKNGSRCLFDWGFGPPPDSCRTVLEKKYLEANSPDAETDYEKRVRGVWIIGVDDL